MLNPSYYNVNQAVYLIDLRKTIPDSILICNKWLRPSINATVPSRTEYKFYSDMMDITFPQECHLRHCLSQTNYTTTTTGKEIYTIGTRTFPLNKT